MCRVVSLGPLCSPASNDRAPAHDPIVGALNVYRFILTIDARYGCLGVAAAPQRDAMRREVVVPLARRLEAMRTHAGAGMTQQWLLHSPIPRRCLTQWLLVATCMQIAAFVKDIIFPNFLQRRCLNIQNIRPEKKPRMGMRTESSGVDG